jgi:hypothetical protein
MSLGLLAWGAAWALGANDRLALTLSDNVRVEGWYYLTDAGVVVLSGDNRFQRVPVALVVGVERNGEPWGAAAFREEIAQAQAALDAYRADPPPHPAPGVVTGLGLVWAGLGHAALGQGGRALSLAALDATLLGVSIWQVRRGQGAVALPLVAMDLTVRAWSARDAARTARRRNATIAGEVPLERAPRAR